MNCDAIQNRLLDLVDPTRGSSELQAHLAGCEACQRFLERSYVLNDLLATVAVPRSSDETKTAFLQTILAAGPVIQTIPRVAVSPWIWQRIPRPVLVRATGLAAALLVSVGVWSAWPDRKPMPELAAAPRHELLQKVVTLNTELARTTTPAARLTKLSNLAVELRNETAALSRAAQKDDLQSLARMYEKVVRDGLIVQATQLNPVSVPLAERQQLLNSVAAELTQTALQTLELATTASPGVQPHLKRIAQTAQDGSLRLSRLARGEGA